MTNSTRKMTNSTHKTANSTNRMANSTANFDDLPAEMIREIFSHLNFNDLISCKQVCRRFGGIVGELRIRCLNVHYPEEAEVYSSESCHPDLFRIQVGQQVEQPILSRLRSLTIAHSFDLDLNTVNQFVELVQLRIGYIRHDQPKLVLTLPRLRELEFFEEAGCNVTVDCLSLERLSCFGWYLDSEFTVKHPETIHTLQTDFHDRSLQPFKNVEYLSCRRNYKILDESTLLALPKLKEIRYCGHFGEFHQREHGEHQWRNVLTRLRRLMERKRTMEKFDLRVFFGCVELVNDKLIGEYEFGQYHTNAERFFMTNYSQLIETDTLEVNYSRLMDFLGGDEVPRDYFDKFSRINTVKVERQGQRIDQEHLLWFLKSLKTGLQVLHLNEASVDHRFFDKLSELFSSTLEVLIFSRPENLDWRFVGKLSKLWRLWLIGRASTLSLEEIEFLLNLKAIHNRYINLRFNGFEVTRQEEGKYRLDDLEAGTRQTEMSIDELVEFFQKTIGEALNDRGDH